MPGKLKAGLFGAIVGAVIVLFVELLAVTLNDEVFFGSERSWLILAIAVVAFAWVQMRAFGQKKGMNADKDDQSNGQHKPDATQR